MKIITKVSATTVGGRDGQGETSDGKFKVQFALPKELGGAGKEGLTPEHLFATGYSACFGSALHYVGGLKKIRLQQIRVTAVVALGQTPEGGFAFDVELQVELPEVDRAQAEALVAEAHRVCPYSNAVKGNVPVKLTVL